MTGRKKNHVYVIEKMMLSGAWSLWDVNDHLVNVRAAREYLSSWENKYPTQKFRLRKYTAD